MNVLIVGLGSIAQKHIKALRDIEPTISLYALRSSANAKCFEGVANLFTLNEVESIPFDFAIISNPTSEHLQSIFSLSQLNIPLFIEKPLYHDLSIQNLVEEIKSKELLTYVACNLRFLEALRFAKQRITDLKLRINEVNAYCGSYLPDWRKGVNYKENYSAIPELGGGVNLDLIHEIDYIYWMFGAPINTQKWLTNSSSLGIRSFDYANYCLAYPGYNVSIILNYYRRDTRRFLELVCESETIYVDLLKNEVFVNGRLFFSSDNRIVDTYEKQLHYFIECLSQKRLTFNTISDAYNVLQICL
ncbi:Gfo/Idh/MocA family oxidoreductase [uncultured Bacteroides sp.]|uniref:Gfo/Idh/MocA family protein n=1 Tax=uncultured Bacteroides sp. TaxID=162156 RepID=UPI0025FF9259|nr:Gfo/Idh/MocA family oxidoreductase [uncultured Bacteroides sp.]